jgi:phosphatidylserine decarboxylase
MRIHKEGYKILGFAIIILAALNILVFGISGAGPVLSFLILFLSVLTLAFLLFFFREPIRPVFHDDTAISAPADGKVVIISEVVEKEYFRQPRLQISVFMSPLNVHSNRYPVSGTVKEVIYHPGKYLVAWHPKSSELNERCTVVLETADGKEILVRQIAGAVARRIVTYARPGQKVNQGDELGFIKFGSRVDIFLPPGFTPDVSIGQSVRANKTVIGKF